MERFIHKMKQIFAITIILFVCHYNLASAQKETNRDALFIGKVMIVLDGYKGINRTLTSDIHVTVSEYPKNNKEHKIKEVTLSTDSDGYFYYKTADKNQNYHITKLKLEDAFSIPFDYNLVTYQPKSIKKQLNIALVCGIPLTCRINEKGSINISTEFKNIKKDVAKMLNHTIIQLETDDPWVDLLRKSKGIVDIND